MFEKEFDSSKDIIPNEDRIIRGPPQKGPLRVSIIPLKKTPDFFEDSHQGIQFQGGPQKKSGYKLAMWTWFSASIDTMVMIAISCFSLIAFSWVVQTHFIELVKEIKTHVNTTQLFGLSFILSFWGYLIFMRVFNSATIGEMACELRLGQPSERMKINYLFKVILRTTLILITGVLPLPLLSLIWGRDLVGEWIGLKIYSLK